MRPCASQQKLDRAGARAVFCLLIGNYKTKNREFVDEKHFLLHFIK